MTTNYIVKPYTISSIEYIVKNEKMNKEIKRKTLKYLRLLEQHQLSDNNNIIDIKTTIIKRNNPHRLQPMGDKIETAYPKWIIPSEQRNYTTFWVGLASLTLEVVFIMAKSRVKKRPDGRYAMQIYFRLKKRERGTTKLFMVQVQERRNNKADDVRAALKKGLNISAEKRYFRKCGHKDFF